MDVIVTLDIASEGLFEILIFTLIGFIQGASTALGGSLLSQLVFNLRCK